MAVQATIDAGQPLATLAPTIAGGLLIVFSMWWIYFDRPVHDLLTSLPKAIFWGYGHYFVFASAAAVGAGLAAAVDQVGHHARDRTSRCGLRGRDSGRRLSALPLGPALPARVSPRRAGSDPPRRRSCSSRRSPVSQCSRSAGSWRRWWRSRSGSGSNGKDRVRGIGIFRHEGHEEVRRARRKSHGLQKAACRPARTAALDALRPSTLSFDEPFVPLNPELRTPNRTRTRRRGEGSPPPLRYV